MAWARENGARGTRVPWIRPLRGLIHGLWGEAVARFHRDQDGAMLDYVLVLGVFVPLAVFVIAKLFEVLSDYFGMIAFYVTWPFL